MVEVVTKPTDISKIQDIMNAINSGGSSDKTGLKVDYAAGSNLESGINELKRIGEKQVSYLKTMVMYQDTMLQNARREDVSSAASNSKNNVADEKQKSELTRVGSAALMSILGPLGPILGQLATGLGLLGGGAVGAAAGYKLRGGGGAGKVRGGAGADAFNKSASASDFKLGGSYEPPEPKFGKQSRLLTVDENLAAQRFNARQITSSTSPFRLTQDMLVNATNSPFKLTRDMLANSKDLKYRAMAMSDTELANAMKTSNTIELSNELKRRLTLKNLPNLSRPEPLKLTEGMRVSNMAPAAEVKIPAKSAKVSGGIGALISAGMGYFDEELKNAGLNAVERVGQGVLEIIPGTIDMFTRGMITDPLNTFTGRGFGTPEEDMYNLDITPSFRKFMLQGFQEQKAKTAAAGPIIAGAPNRMTAFRTAMAPVTVPNTTFTQPPAAPIVIAPPAAPASSIVNSNNQQTTIVNQTKDVSASLYMHMLGGN